MSATESFPVLYRRALSGSPFEGCPIEMLDATYEDESGRLPHEPGYTDPYHTRRDRMTAVTDAMTGGRRSTIMHELAKGPRSSRDLEQACGVGRGALSTLLRQMEDDHAIVLKEAGSRSGPAVYAVDTSPISEDGHPLDEDGHPLDEEPGESTLKEDARNRAAGIDPDDQEAEGVSVGDVDAMERRIRELESQLVTPTVAEALAAAAAAPQPPDVTLTIRLRPAWVFDAVAALGGDSNDDEHDCLVEITEVVRQAVTDLLTR